MIEVIKSIPQGWEQVPLGNVVEKICNGLVRRQHKDGAGVPVTRIETISNEIIDLTRVGYLSDIDDETIKKYLLLPGDLLFSHINSDKHLGKTALFYGQNEVLLHGMNLLLIRVNKNIIIPKYLQYHFKYFRNSGKFIEIAQHAVNQSSINQKTLQKLLILLPSITDQQRIVAKIEELFTRLDAGVENLKKTRQLLKNYRQAVLRDAFTGKLTEKWRNEQLKIKQSEYLREPAAKLLERIIGERCNKSGSKIDKYIEPVSLSNNTDFVIPEQWLLVRAEIVSEFITKGTTPQKDELFSDEGEVPFIKVYNLTFDISLDFKTNPTFITKKTHNGFLARSRVFPKDVLMNIVGPPLGKVSIVPDIHPEWNINQAIVRFRPLPGYSYKFLARMLTCDYIQKWAAFRSKATAGQFNLTLEICRNLPLPLPPFAEQKQIVLEIERHFSIVDAVEKEINEALKKSDSLRQSILKSAFEGKLVTTEYTHSTSSGQAKSMEYPEFNSERLQKVAAGNMKYEIK